MNYKLKFAYESLKKDIDRVEISVDLRKSVIITKNETFQLSVDRTIDQYKTTLRKLVESEKIRIKKDELAKYDRLQPRLF